jgi:hypothetical protein
MANEIYNTTWWGNALDTARTAGTDPDFFGSQMKLLTSEQDSIVTNGDFDTDSGWEKGTGWTISGGKANSDGTQSVSYLRQNNIVNLTSLYRIKFTVSNSTSGTLKYIKGNGGAATIVTNNGEYSFETTWDGSSPDLVFQSLNFVGSIDNVSIQLVRADLDQIEAKKCLADWIHRTALQDLNN